MNQKLQTKIFALKTQIWVQRVRIWNSGKKCTRFYLMIIIHELLDQFNININIRNYQDSYISYISKYLWMHLIKILYTLLHWLKLLNLYLKLIYQRYQIINRHPAWQSCPTRRTKMEIKNWASNHKCQWISRSNDQD